MQRKLLIYLASIILCLLLVSCGTEKNDNAYNLKNNVSSNPFLSQYTCEDVYPEYDYFVTNGNYEAALNFVCKVYKLNCENYNIYINPADKVGYAYTNLWTNVITLNYKAFHFPFCGTENKAYDGWLAAILAHEMIHVNQDWWQRFAATVLKNKKVDAILEIEAWQYMWDNADYFRFTTRMKLEVDAMIEEYKEVLY